jgi:hypothetical protein
LIKAKHPLPNPLPSREREQIEVLIKYFCNLKIDDLAKILKRTKSPLPLWERGRGEGKNFKRKRKN